MATARKCSGLLRFEGLTVSKSGQKPILLSAQPGKIYFWVIFAQDVVIKKIKMGKTFLNCAKVIWHRVQALD